jgi:hypothetical protein
VFESSSNLATREPTVRATVLALLLTCSLTSACFPVRFAAPGALRAGVPEGETSVRWSHSLFWGALPVKRVNLEQLCPESSVLRMRSGTGFWGLAGQLLTLGLWAPMRVEVTCARPARADDVVVLGVLPAGARGPGTWVEGVSAPVEVVAPAVQPEVAVEVEASPGPASPEGPMVRVVPAVAAPVAAVGVVSPPPPAAPMGIETQAEPPQPANKAAGMEVPTAPTQVVEEMEAPW